MQTNESTIIKKKNSVKNSVLVPIQKFRFQSLALIILVRIYKYMIKIKVPYYLAINSPFLQSLPIFIMI